MQEIARQASRNARKNHHSRLHLLFDPPREKPCRAFRCRLTERSGHIHPPIPERANGVSQPLTDFE
jgi:hypothetical protein